jgi:hypothetical protein
MVVAMMLTVMPYRGKRRSSNHHDEQNSSNFRQHLTNLARRRGGLLNDRL